MRSVRARRCLPAVSVTGALLALAGVAPAPLVGGRPSPAAAQSPQPAPAPAPWSSASAHVPHATGEAAAVAVGAAGTVAAAWPISDLNRPLRTGLALLRADGGIAARTTVAGVPVGAPMIDSRGRASVVMVGVAIDVRAIVSTTGLRVATVGAGPASVRHLTGQGVRAGNASLAANERGAAVLAWFELNARREAVRLQVARRDAAGVWTRPQTLQRGAAGPAREPNVAVAISASGVVSVAADDLGRRAGLVVWAGSGARLERQQRIATRRPSGVLRTTVLATGRPLVAWATRERAASGDERYVTRMVGVPRPPEPLPAVQELADGGRRALELPGLDLAAAPDGSAVLAVAVTQQLTAPLVVATVQADGRLAAPQFFPGDLTLGGVAVGRDGAAVITATESATSGAMRDRQVAFVRGSASSAFVSTADLPIRVVSAGPLLGQPQSDPPSPFTAELAAVTPRPSIDPASGDVLVAVTGAATNRAGPTLTLLRRPLP